jgi:hypothetical protein
VSRVHPQHAIRRVGIFRKDPALEQVRIDPAWLELETVEVVVVYVDDVDLSPAARLPHDSRLAPALIADQGALLARRLT